MAGIPYSYTIELRDKGPVYGFLLPPELVQYNHFFKALISYVFNILFFFSYDSQIIPSGIETWEAFKVIAENVAKMP